MRRLVPLIALCLALAAPSPALADCADADLEPSAANLDRIEAATACLHNEERARAGLPALAWSHELAAAAEGHSLDMVGRLFFGHTTPDGVTPRVRIEASGYGPAWSGENIYYAFGRGFTPREAVAAWMASPGHRANVLRPEFEDLGLAS